MITLARGAYEAVINPLGASMAALTVDGRALLLAQDGEGTAPRYRGAVLAPWPVRLEDGTYEFDGAVHTLPVNEPERGTALHGLVFDQTWDVLSQESDTAMLAYRIDSPVGYPFSLDLRLTYRLDDGLGLALEATNTGSRRAPYGCGFHPYLVPGPVPVDDASVSLEAPTRITVTADRLLPTGSTSTAGTDHDLADRPRLGNLVLDDMFTGVTADDEGVGRAVAGGVEIWWDAAALPYVQTFTPPERNALAIEPCSCPANAFRSGEGLVVLEPGATHCATIGIRAI